MTQYTRLMADHPNQPWANSVIASLTDGFWPCHSGEPSEPKVSKGRQFPSVPRTDEDRDFIQALVEKQVANGWISPSFDEHIDGLEYNEIFVNRRPGKKPRCVNNQNQSGHNDEIDIDDCPITMDTVTDLLRILRHLHFLTPERAQAIAVAWKLDIKAAFKFMCMHRWWQARVAILVAYRQPEGSLVKWVFKRHIEWRAAFGTRASPFLWTALNSSFMWICQFHAKIERPLAYVDDWMGIDITGRRRYLIKDGARISMPTDQARTAEDLDLLNVPWELEKAESGPTLVITGILVDARKGTASLADEALAELIRKIYSFLTDHGRCPQLRVWRELAGHLNWSLTVFPLIRPLVNPVFAKLSLPHGQRKNDRYAPVWHNTVIKASLRDIIIHLSDPTPLDILDTGSTQWTREEADVIIYTDACKHCDDGTGAGLGFYFEYRGETHMFFSRPEKFWESIIFAEAITVVAALFEAIARLPDVLRILILCDNSPSVYGFDTGAANDSEFCPLRQLVLAAFMAVRFKTKFDFRVLHVQGKKNELADMLSRWLVSELKQMNDGDIFAKKRVKFHARHKPNPVNPKRPFPPLEDLTGLRDHLRSTSLEKSTLKNYQYALRAWTTFAFAYAFNMLPSKHTLSLFIAGRLSYVNYIRGTLSGLAFYLRPLMTHLSPDWDQVRKSFEVQQTIRGGIKWKAHQAKKAVPLRNKDIRKWAEVAMDPGCGYETLYFVARLIILFFCCARAGEITMPDDKDARDDRKTVMRHSVVASPTSFEATVPYMKNDPLFTGSHFLFTSSISEPIFTAVVFKWLQACDARHGLAGPLFLDSRGKQSTRSSFVRKLKKLLGKQYTGHSGRCGGATYYILWGVDHETIKRLGRWKSDAWLEYIRIVPALAKAILYRKAMDKREKEAR